MRSTGPVTFAGVIAGVIAAVAAAWIALAPAAGAATLPPVLTDPTASTSYTHAVPVTYTLPQTPLAGSVRLTFSGSTTCVLTMLDVPTVNFVLDTTNPLGSGAVGSSTCGSIPDGTYTVVLSYQDQAADPSASALATAVVIGPAAATTTTTTTTTTAPTATTTTLAITTSTAVVGRAAATGSTTTTDPSAVANASLAATGSSSAVPLTAIGSGVIAIGVGVLLLRVRAGGDA